MLPHISLADMTRLGCDHVLGSMNRESPRHANHFRFVGKNWNYRCYRVCEGRVSKVPSSCHPQQYLYRCLFS